MRVIVRGVYPPEGGRSYFWQFLSEAPTLQMALAKAKAELRRTDYRSFRAVVDWQYRICK